MKKIFLYSGIAIAFSFLISSCSNEASFTNDSVASNQTEPIIEETQPSNEIQESFGFNDDIARYRGVINNGIRSSTIFYPKNTGAEKLPVVIVMHGFLRSKEKMRWIGKQIAKKGFIALTVTASNNRTIYTNPRDWVWNYKASFANIKKENNRRNSPLYGKIDTNRISIVGHSMGGGGAFYFADKTSENIKCIVSLAPYANEAYKPGRRTQCPSIILAGGRDILAPTEMTKQIYQSVGSRVKDFAYYRNAKHLDFEGRMFMYKDISKKMLNWLERYGK